MADHSHACLPPFQPAPSGDHALVVMAPHQQLPAGKCSFRELASGAATQTCGCRRFWLNHATSLQSASSEGPTALSMETAWCFCGHHACYHDFEQSQSSLDRSLVTTYHTNGINQHSAQSQRAQDFAPGLGLYLNGDHVSKRSIPFSPVDQNVYHRQQSPQTQYSSRLPSDAPSTPAPHAIRQSPSRAFLTHIETRRARSSALETSPLTRPDPLEDYIQSATEAATPSLCGDTILQDADEAVHKTCVGIDVLSKQHVDRNQEDLTRRTISEMKPADLAPSPTAQSQITLIENLIIHVRDLKHILSSRPGLVSSISDLDKRMDALETMSYNHGYLDEFHERFEHLDGRLLEIEGKIDELEKSQPAPDESTCAPNQMAPSTAKPALSYNSEMMNNDSPMTSARQKRTQLQRLTDLEQRLVDLEASGIPSAMHPWNVEVVLLPWGHDLKGIWSSESEASQASRLQTQESATVSSRLGPSRDHQSNDRLPNSTSASTNQFAPEWPGDDHFLLWARACGATSGTGGRVYKRLASRGFVRTITLSCNDARTIHRIICEAFGDHLELSQARDGKDLTSGGIPRCPSLLGFRSPFIPLRKVHRSSRLRFLSVSELASPLIWTGDFLDADVFMKAPTTGLRRLYVTMPAAYFQSTKHHGWTWQTIRELPRTDLACDHESGSQVLEGNANEPSWAWDPKLDSVPASVHTSFASMESFSKHASFHSSQPLSPDRTQWSEESDPEYEPNTRRESTAPEGIVLPSKQVNGPITPTSGSAPASLRRAVSASSPGRVAVSARPPESRRIHSFGTAHLRAPTKRPRASPSSDDIGTAVHGRWALTPCRSRGPGSPLVPTTGSNISSDALSSGVRSATAKAKRGTTPSAYATPFSNSFAPIGGLGNSWEGGDTDMDSSSESNGDDGMSEAGDTEFAEPVDTAFDRAVMLEEDVWEGVGGDASESEEEEQASNSSHDGSVESEDDGDDLSMDMSD